MPLSLVAERPPLPPADLILRVVPSFSTDRTAAAVDAFDVRAFEHLKGFEQALAVAGQEFSDFNRLLDFGCGCGRFIRHLGQISTQVEIHGTDIDAEMIEWLSRNVSYGKFVVAPHEPPLPYPDDYFDLIINHSVFSHLDEEMQDVWLAELQRITAPGGLLLLTVEGTASWNRLSRMHERDPLLWQWRHELESRGILFIRDDAFIGSTHPDFYHSTIHAPWYVFEHWVRYFALLGYLPEGSHGQDLVIAKKRAESDPVDIPISALQVSPSVMSRPGARRELASLVRYVARQLRGQRDLDPAAQNRELEMLRAGLYEQSNRISVIAAELREELATVAHSREGGRSDTLSGSEE
jgi:SAM-dependent methyltransferase